MMIAEERKIILDDTFIIVSLRRQIRQVAPIIRHGEKVHSKVRPQFLTHVILTLALGGIQ